MNDNPQAIRPRMVIDVSSDVPCVDGEPFRADSNELGMLVFEAVQQSRPHEGFPLRIMLRTRSGAGEYLLTGNAELLPADPAWVPVADMLEVQFVYGDSEPSAPTRRRPAPEPEPELEILEGELVLPGDSTEEIPPDRAEAEAPSVPMTRAQAKRESFLKREGADRPAECGWRGLLNRVGLHVPPSEAEMTERAAVGAISRHWTGPRTIAVVNGKGGAGKTPTTLMLAATFARYGGVGVLAWDNNQTRGTLGWRTEQAEHDSTLLDLLPEADRLMSAEARFADLAHYVHHQRRDKYDVLRSQPMALAHQQRLFRHDVDLVHAVATKYYRVIVMDSGNDESDPMWRRMIELADSVVVATTTRDDHAEAGALLLEALASGDEHARHLASNATVVVNRADPRASDADVQRVVHGYRSLSRAVATIPYDRGMVDGVLQYGSLRRVTQRAWLQAAAAVAAGL